MFISVFNFILIFSPLVASAASVQTQVEYSQVKNKIDGLRSGIKALYHPQKAPDSEDGEALSDETLDKLFNDPAKKSVLVESERSLRVHLSKVKSCGHSHADHFLSREWLALARLEIDLYNLGLDDKMVENAIAAARNSIGCDAENVAARRLLKELGRQISHEASGGI